MLGETGGSRLRAELVFQRVVLLFLLLVQFFPTAICAAVPDPLKAGAVCIDLENADFASSRIKCVKELSICRNRRVEISAATQ
jgi:hypothetical protein